MHVYFGMILAKYYFCIIYWFFQHWYSLSKTLAEEAAWRFAKDNGIDLLTINPGVVFGPLLQPALNFSSEVIINLTKGILSSHICSVFHLIFVGPSSHLLEGKIQWEIICPSLYFIWETSKKTCRVLDIVLSQTELYLSTCNDFTNSSSKTLMKVFKCPNSFLSDDIEHSQMLNQQSIASNM